MKLHPTYHKQLKEADHVVKVNCTKAFCKCGWVSKKMDRCDLTQEAEKHYSQYRPHCKMYDCLTVVRYSGLCSWHLQQARDGLVWGL